MPTTPEPTKSPEAVASTPSSTPPSGTPPPATSSAANPIPAVSEFRYAHDPNVPEWARGKTANEVLAMTKAMVESFGRSTPQPPAAAAAAQTQYNAALPTVTPTLDPDAFVTGRDIQSFRDSALREFGERSNRAIENAAQSVYAVGGLRYPKEFGRYAPEIQGYLARVPKENWTLDTIDLAVKLVKADHLADYRSEWEQEFRSTVDPTTRSIGNAGSAPTPQADKSHSLESDAIPTEWKLKAQKAGITEATIEEFCRTNDMTREDFFKMFASGNVVTEGAPA